MGPPSCLCSSSVTEERSPSKCAYGTRAQRRARPFNPAPSRTCELSDLDAVLDLDAPPSAPPSPREHAIDEQQYHSPDEARHDRRYPLSGAPAPAEADGSDEPTPHNGPHNPDDDRHYYSAWVTPRHDQLR